MFQGFRAASGRVSNVRRRRRFGFSSQGVWPSSPPCGLEAPRQVWGVISFPNGQGSPSPRCGVVGGGGGGGVWVGGGALSPTSPPIGPTVLYCRQMLASMAQTRSTLDKFGRPSLPISRTTLLGWRGCSSSGGWGSRTSPQRAWHGGLARHRGCGTRVVCFPGVRAYTMLPTSSRLFGPWTGCL